MTNEKKVNLSVLNWIVISISILGFIFYILGTFQKEERFLLYLIGFVLVASSSYFSYKALEKLVKNKQLIGGFWISLVVSFLSFHFFSIVQAPEENSINFLFRNLKGQTGKSTVATESGIIEQFNPPPRARRDIHIIGIKTETIDKVRGQWPLDWQYYASVVKLFENTDNMLLIDVFFIDPKPRQMEILSAALKGKPTVIVDYPIETTYGSKETIPDLSKRHEILRKYKLKNVIDTEGVSWLVLAIPPIP
ncbi:MAG: CHASE2 domain-containing protein, partial [Leptospiraceae bacterium]|nr:CHASE2 domain-containing protein [Leptospiraceae bacterium]